MSVSIKGTDQILKNIESKLGKNKANRVINKALKKTGDRSVDIVRESVNYYRRTGATVEEVVRSNVKNSASGIKEVDIGWRGDKDRWRLVHLNEFGYSPHGVFHGQANAERANGNAFYKPRGYGAVQKAADKIKGTAYKDMRSDLEELGK